MFVDDLFDKKTLTENRGGGSPWHSEPEQQQMDANRRGGLERERNAGLDEPDDALSGSAPTGNGVYEYTVPAGQEDIAQELGLQQHRGHWVSRVPIQRANFQFGRPQFHEIPSQGVAEAATPASTSKVLRLIQRHHSDWFDTYGIGEVEDAVVDMAEMGQFQGMSAEDAVALVAQELDSLYGAQGMAEGLMSKKQLQAQQAQINHLIRQGYELDPKDNRWRKPKNNNTEPKKKEQGVSEGILDNPGEQDSPVAQAIVRRILLQRTDLLAKYGPEKVGAAVDEVADFVGDVEEIGSSDVSGWIRHVEQMLGNMDQGVAEGRATYGPITANHKDAAKKAFAAGERDGKAGAEKNKQYMSSALMKTTYLNGYKQGKQGVAEGSKEKTPGIALSKAYKKDFDDKKPGHDRAETALTGTYSKTGKPGGELKKKGVKESDNPVAKIKAPRAPSSPALAIPKAPAVAETIAQVERMLESVTSKKSADMIRAYVDQKFTELGLRNTTECRNLMTHVVQESAIRRRQYAKSLAK